MRDGYQTYVIDYHPFDVVGWDGYVYPWTFSIHDFEPITGRIHMPPPSHQTFDGPNFVICSFCPRKLDFDPEAIPIPYHHSNLQSEEMIYYVDGNFSSRKGIEVGSVTLHPSGLPHGPQPGLAEKSLGMTETHEYAVMCDTFNPLRLTTLAADLDDGKYMFSWAEDPSPGDGRTTDDDPAGVTSHLQVARPTGTAPDCRRLARGSAVHDLGDPGRLRREFESYGEALAEEIATHRHHGRGRRGLGDRERRTARRVPRAGRPGVRPVIVSSGLPQLILPVLEREGVGPRGALELREPSPDGWRVLLRHDGLCRVCGDPV